MSQVIRLLGFLMIFAVAGVSAAKADVVYWKDQVSGVSVSYPDRWGKVHDMSPDTILTVAAPGDKGSTEDAQCRLRVREDRRFVIYPAGLSDEVQRLHFSRGFWEGYANEYRQVSFGMVEDNAGLGRGDASSVIMTYRPMDGSTVRRRSIAFASLYNNHVHIVECSAQLVSFFKWEPVFRNIVKSVDFRKSVHEKKSGEYRDFTSDRGLRIHGTRRVDHYLF